MKITSQEEYGLRILLRIALSPDTDGLTIPRLSEEEGISQHYVAKLCRLLRIAGFVKSSRGKEGGYYLALPAAEIRVGNVLEVLGGRLYSQKFCGRHKGHLENCAHTGGCSVRFIWQKVQGAVDQVLENISLQDLLDEEKAAFRAVPADSATQPA